MRPARDEPGPSAPLTRRRSFAWAAVAAGLPTAAGADTGAAAAIAGTSALLAGAALLAIAVVRRSSRRAPSEPEPAPERRAGEPAPPSARAVPPDAADLPDLDGAGIPSGGSGPSADLTTLPPGSDPFRRLVSTLEASGAVPETPLDVVEAIISSSTRSRDHETIGHSCRVARLAVALAERIGLRGETLTAIEWGALLHDVGKTIIPREVLDKPGPLSADEMTVIRQHPRQGYQMLKHLVFLGPALDIVLSHHERWDGRGYPNGLAGERIPLPARVFAVVDTYDAITSDRPYRAARGHDEATAELRRVAGTQLDPRVVERFLEIPEADVRRLRVRSLGAAADPAPAADEAPHLAEPARRRHGTEAC